MLELFQKWIWKPWNEIPSTKKNRTMNFWVIKETPSWELKMTFEKPKACIVRTWRLLIESHKIFPPTGNVRWPKVPRSSEKFKSQLNNGYFKHKNPRNLHYSVKCSKKTVWKLHTINKQCDKFKFFECPAMQRTKSAKSNERKLVPRNAPALTLWNFHKIWPVDWITCNSVKIWNDG